MMSFVLYMKPVSNVVDTIGPPGKPYIPKSTKNNYIAAGEGGRHVVGFLHVYTCFPGGPEQKIKLNI